MKSDPDACRRRATANGWQVDGELLPHGPNGYFTRFTITRSESHFMAPDEP